MQQRRLAARSAHERDELAALTGLGRRSAARHLGLPALDITWSGLKALEDWFGHGTLLPQQTNIRLLASDSA